MMDEGTSAIAGSRAASGLLNSGSTGKALMSFGQSMASQEWDNWLSGLGETHSMAGGTAQRGLSAAGGVAQAAGSAGTQQADIDKEGTENMMSGIGGLAKGVASIFGF